MIFWLAPALQAAGTAGAWLLRVGGRVLFGKEAIKHTTAQAKRIFQAARPLRPTQSTWSGAVEVAQGAAAYAAPYAQRLGSRLISAGTGVLAGKEALDIISGTGGNVPTSPYQNGYAVGGGSFVGPTQAPGNGMALPRGVQVWMDPWGNVYMKRKRRRMNPLNPRALRRAHTRALAFDRFVKRNFQITRKCYAKPKRRRRRR